MFKIKIKYQLFSGSNLPKIRWVTDHRSGDPCLYPTRQAAQEAAAELDNEVHELASGEAGRPEYVVVSAAASEMGTAGGRSTSEAKSKAAKVNMATARASVSLSAEERSERAKNAAKARWTKKNKKQ